MSQSRTPAGLKAAGRRLWQDIHAHLDLDQHEAELLLQACRVLDRLDALASILDSDGVMLDGKPHPALVEARHQQLVFARLIATLRLPEDIRSDHRPQRRGAARGTYDTRLKTVNS